MKEMTMANDPSGSDPKTIWQSQAREKSTVTLERMIRRRAEELHAKTLRERLSSLIAPPSVVVFSGIGMAEGNNPVQRAVFAIALVWSLAGAYVLNRGVWPARLAGDAALATGLEFCRKEIERRLYFHRQSLLWAFAPIVLAGGALVAFTERGVFAKTIPFLTLFVLWVIGIFFFRRVGWRKLQREIDDLNDIESENRS
jgi:hypothetical protein